MLAGRPPGRPKLKTSPKQNAGTSESVLDCLPSLARIELTPKRREKQAELLSAQPWDLIIVDEARHARRRVRFQDLDDPEATSAIFARINRTSHSVRGPFCQETSIGEPVFY